jgi:hypothetical protein
VAVINVGCDEAPEERRIAVIPATQNIRAFDIFRSKGVGKACSPVPDHETGSELNLLCTGENQILMWDEDENGSFVPGSAQQCCL